MEAEFNIKGLAALNKELKRLPEDFSKKALAGAVGAAARLLRDAAKDNVPVNTGNLKSALRAKKKKTHSKYISNYAANIKSKGANGVPSYYGFIVENGSNKMPARPFMRTAFDENREQAVMVFNRILDKKIKFYQRKIERMKAK